MLTAQSILNIKNQDQKIWTAADPTKGYKITDAGIDKKGRLSITAEKGLYSFFVSGGSNKTDNEKQGPEATTRKAVKDIKITKAGNWKGQASFYLDQFAATFSGAVSADLRNYSGTSDYVGKLPYIYILDGKGKKIGNHAIVFGESKVFGFDKEGKLVAGVLYDGTQRKESVNSKAPQAAKAKVNWSLRTDILSAPII